MDLKCKKLDCKYNKTFACTKEGIGVQKDCVCGSYEKNTDLPPEQKQNVGKDMFKKVPDIHPFRHSKDMCIKCKAACIFNNQEICKANGITIMGWKENPLCCTFIKK